LENITRNVKVFYFSVGLFRVGIVCFESGKGVVGVVFRG
jgi:hypothetical protein